MTSDPSARRSEERWEHGSDFDYPDVVPSSATAPGQVAASSRFAGASYWHSGRDALRGLARAHRFSRVLFPSFYCQDVPLALAADGHAVLAYPDAPGDARIDVASLDLRAGDALVVSNTLGLRGASPLEGTLPSSVTLIEDHTHDPFSTWARTTRAPYAFASLRKWLPLPDGGVLWSGTGMAAPGAPAFDAAHAAVTLARLSGMLLKARYLAGEAIDKAAYRALSVDGEERIAHGPAGAMSPLARALLDVLPMDAHRAARRENHAHAAEALSGLAEVALLEPAGASAREAVPFAVTLLLPDAARRDALRAALAAERIYGAVLWPIDAGAVPGVPAAHAELSGRVLSLHCDARYSREDMARVAAAVRRLSASSGSAAR